MEWNGKWERYNLKKNKIAFWKYKKLINVFKAIKVGVIRQLDYFIDWTSPLPLKTQNGKHVWTDGNMLHNKVIKL